MSPAWCAIHCSDPHIEGDLIVIFSASKLLGVYVMDEERLEDERGYFARTWCAREGAARGLNSQFVQCSVSFNRNRGTLRGLHYQEPPHAEAKLIRCLRGAMYDVVVDLRPDSSTFRNWIAVELSDQNRRTLYVPEGCAHGFQTLTDNVEVYYQISQFFHPESARTVRWDDPLLGIEWPLAVRVISEKDQSPSSVL